MYSVVLLMAMNSGGDMPALGRRGGGCGGGCYGGCYGGGGGRRHHGRRGGGGCCGGGGYGGCYGGGGGCYGGGYGGCYGGGYGGCYGGGYSSGCYGGGYGGCYGGGGYAVGCYGGGYGVGCYGGGYGVGGTSDTTGTGEKIGKPKHKEESKVPAPATIVVSLPANAQLLIDDAPTTSTGSRRVFVSPNLEPGRDFHYTLKAIVMRDGKPVTVKERVAVRAGRAVEVPIKMPAIGVALR